MGKKLGLDDLYKSIGVFKMKISATDMETSMSTEVQVESKENGRIAIPARAFANYKLTDEQRGQYLITTYGKIIFNNI